MPVLVLFVALEMLAGVSLAVDDNICIKRGDKIELSCGLKESSDVQWYIDDEVLCPYQPTPITTAAMTTQTTTCGGDVLNISSIDRSGVYKCVSGDHTKSWTINAIGDLNTIVMFNTSVVNSPLVSLKWDCAQCVNTTYHIRWSEGRQLYPNYQQKYYRNGGSVLEMDDDNADICEKLIGQDVLPGPDQPQIDLRWRVTPNCSDILTNTNFEAYWSYDLCITMVTANGNFTSGRKFETPPGMPHPIRKERLVKVDSSSMQLTWWEPLYWRGPRMQYNITYSFRKRHVDGTEGVLLGHKVTTLQSTYTFMDISPDTEVNISIATHNGFYSSLYTNFKYKTDRQRPSVPWQVVVKSKKPQTFIAQWMKPNETYGADVRYFVMYASEENPAGWTTIPVEGLLAEVNNIVPGFYLVKIAALVDSTHGSGPLIGEYSVAEIVSVMKPQKKGSVAGLVVLVIVCGLVLAALIIGFIVIKSVQSSRIVSDSRIEISIVTSLSKTLFLPTMEKPG